MKPTPTPTRRTRRRLLARATAVAATVAAAALATGCAVVPEPWTQDQLRERAETNRRAIVEDEVPVTGTIGLHEAMARALKHNLDYRVAMLEEAVRSRELDRAGIDMLPKLVANAGWTSRDNDSGGRSRSLLTGRESLEPSTSSERSNLAADLSVGWDVLDFGLSYVRAQQAADQVMVALENRRRIANRLIEDVRTAYWRAVGAERLAGRLDRLGREVDAALADSRELETRRNAAPLLSLNYQRELIDAQRQILSLRRELHVAKAQLSALMNLAPGSNFSLRIPERHGAAAALCMAPEQMMLQALSNRSELREIAYRMRINDREGQAAWLRRLPSLRAFLGIHYDSNDYLYNNHRVGHGVRASWNLIDTFRYPSDRRVIDAQATWLGERERALTMAVMTQVHVSRAQYDFARVALDAADRYAKVQTRITDQVGAAFKASQESRQRLIREELNALLADLKHDIAYAEMQGAFANFYSAIGLDSFDPDVTSRESIPQLASALEKLWAQRQDMSFVLGPGEGRACP
jgi:outer membrane protein TolC